VQILRVLGQIAGIGGIALGVLLLVFRDFLKKSVFAKLTKDQSFRLLRLLLILTWSVAMVGIVAWIWPTTARNGNGGGSFEITEVLVTPNEDRGSWNLDFRTLNNSARTVTLNRLRLTVVSYEHSGVSYEHSDPPPGNLTATATYEVDLEPFRFDGAVAEHPIAQVLQPLEADRFIVVVGLSNFHLGEQHKWHIEPTLVTSEGEVRGEVIEITIPYGVIILTPRERDPSQSDEP